MLQTKPVIRHPYETGDINPYDEWLARYDLTPKDGSFLADHKDKIPAIASAYLLAPSVGSQPTLRSNDELLAAVGLRGSGEGEIPIYANWTSPDGVYARIVTGLANKRGIIAACTEFAKRSPYDLWIPLFDQNGKVDPYRAKNPFSPLIWDPDFYHAGVDLTDEFATEGVMARPHLGLDLTRALSLVPDAEQRVWRGPSETLALRSEAWGQWESDPDDNRGRVHNGGSILWARREWLNRAAATLEKAFVQTVELSKYKSSRYDDGSKSVKRVIIALHDAKGAVRIWPAKKASAQAGY